MWLLSGWSLYPNGKTGFDSHKQGKMIIDVTAVQASLKVKMSENYY